MAKKKVDEMSFKKLNPTQIEESEEEEESVPS